jgi:hypothetical protein
MALNLPSANQVAGFGRARRHHRRAPPGNLSARSIQFGTPVAPSLPEHLQRMRCGAEGWHRGLVRPVVHAHRALMAAVLAGHEQATDAVPAHAAERSTLGHWTHLTGEGLNLVAAWSVTRACPP